ncbi:MAG: hypothetical protein AAF489_13005 [Bacteroidota bacterium]
MKINLFIAILFSTGSFTLTIANEPDVEPIYISSIEIEIAQLVRAIHEIKSEYETRANYLYRKLYYVNKRLKITSNPIEQLNGLLEKDSLKEQLIQLRLNEQTDISKIRYIKGLQIIKILYEKTLSLDHHFASVSTFSEINKISNPNNYPEFASIKELIKSKKDKRSGFDLTKVLGNNIYTSVAHSLISLFTDTSTSREDKQANLQQVECILDFTLRMHNDLNTIHFETKFLQKNNDNIMNELQRLFVDFTKPIQYKKQLKECRNKDDWDSVREYLDEYLKELDLVMADESERRKAQKMQINLEFPIDRLLQFITQYNAFIDQGGKFYEKFGIMLSSYENEKQCGDKTPIEYLKLKENVSIAIEKFNTAYKPVEINGSKMKEILYGINEYE